jgi:ATP-dependent DNA helicase RecG
VKADKSPRKNAPKGPEGTLGRLRDFGVEAPWQAALLLPRDYEDMSRPVTRFQDLELGAHALVRGRVASPPKVATGRGPARCEVTLEDELGDQLKMIAFGEIRALRALEQGATVSVFGLADIWRDQPQLRDPEIVAARWLGRVRGVYPGKVNYSANGVRTRIYALLPQALGEAANWLRERFGLATVEAEVRLLGQAGAAQASVFELLKAAHVPATLEDGRRAVRVLCRLGALDVVQRAKAVRDVAEAQPARPVACPPERLATLRAALPWAYTDDQEAAVAEILADLAAEAPMRRLLSGDVGTGKTAVFGLACAATVAAGGRAAVLVPNSVLGQQIHREVTTWWPELDPQLVVGESRKPPSSHFLIGTTALLSRLPAELYPDLVVVDEQQKFSRAQREQLLAHGSNLLEATATCIPRSMALAQYGGMAVSRLTRCHVDKTIETRYLAKKQESRLLRDVAQTVDDGGQVLVVYPMVEAGQEGKTAHLTSVEEAVKTWDGRFPGRVAHVHGRMKEHEKALAIDALRDGRADVLVATTVVEVGIDLPELRHVVVVHPERFGLTTLHQLRGRVARGGGFGRCDLFHSTAHGDKTRTRLEVLCSTADGFEVALADMRLRGFGDVAADSEDQAGAIRSFLLTEEVRVDDVEWAVGVTEGGEAAFTPAANPIDARLRKRLHAATAHLDRAELEAAGAQFDTAACQRIQDTIRGGLEANRFGTVERFLASTLAALPALEPWQAVAGERALLGAGAVPAP